MTNNELLITRRAVPMSQADLAKALGCSRQTVINWERGVHAIPAKMVSAIAQACTSHLPKPSAKLTLQDKTAIEVYTKMRRNPGELGTHVGILKFWASEGFTPSPAAQTAILAAFPDILA